VSYSLGRLRQLYAQVLDGRVKDPAEVAQVLGPLLEALDHELTVAPLDTVRKTVDATLEAVIKLVGAIPDKRRLIAELEELQEHAQTVKVREHLS